MLVLVVVKVVGVILMLIVIVLLLVVVVVGKYIDTNVDNTSKEEARKKGKNA